MAKSSSAGRGSKTGPRTFHPTRWILRWGIRALALIILAGGGLVVLWGSVNPPTTLYMLSEGRRLGGVQHDWAPMERIAPVMARAAVAAEDANFCLHWGFDVTAIRAAIADGGNRGANDDGHDHHGPVTFH